MTVLQCVFLSFSVNQLKHDRDVHNYPAGVTKMSLHHHILVLGGIHIQWEQAPHFAERQSGWSRSRLCAENERTRLRFVTRLRLEWYQHPSLHAVLGVLVATSSRFCKSSSCRVNQPSTKYLIIYFKTNKQSFGVLHIRRHGSYHIKWRSTQILWWGDSRNWGI